MRSATRRRSRRCSGSGASHASESRRLRKPSRYPSVSDYVRLQLEATPLAAVLDRREQPERDRLVTLLVDELSTELATFVRDGELAFLQLAHVATVNSR